MVFIRMDALEEIVVLDRDKGYLLVSNDFVHHRSQLWPLSLSSTRPHRGAGRSVLPGQLLHSSILKRDPRAIYTPKAILNHLDSSDFGTLLPRDWHELESCRHRSKLPQWIELDLYDNAVQYLKNIHTILNDNNTTESHRTTLQAELRVMV